MQVAFFSSDVLRWYICLTIDPHKTEIMLEEEYVCMKLKIFRTKSEMGIRA
jgi:hypothetical protein